MLILDTTMFTANGVELTKTEWEILKYLVEQKRVCSKMEILEHLYPDRDVMPLLNTVEVYVKYIRNRIGQDYIKTRRGFGYYVDMEGKQR